MNANQTDRVEGPVHLTLRLDEVEAVKNPELIGKAEWKLRILIDDREVWANEVPLSVGQGERCAVGATIHQELLESQHFVSLRAEGTELDRVSRDEHAESKTVRLYRTSGFGRTTGLALDVLGPGAHLVLHFSIEAASAAVPS